MKSLFDKIQVRAFARVDIASLVFFRVAFGLIMLFEVVRYFKYGWIDSHWLEPRILFKYYGFWWVHPWPGNWLYVHWAALGVFAFFVTIGFLYRISALLMFLSYAYFFLLEEVWYVNHTYLLCLFCFLLIFVPAHRAFSIDSWLRASLRSNTAPAWSLWLLRFQIGVVYFFAGLVKLSPDWLRGEPIRYQLSQAAAASEIPQFFSSESFVYLLSYGGMLFDLLIVPLLLWRRTRLAAFCFAVFFHITNALWQPIGIFPWLAIAATALYLTPDWPRRVLRALRISRSTSTAPAQIDSITSSRARERIVLAGLAIYAALQIFLPLRPLLWRGGIEWTWAEHRFSWRMFLLAYSSAAHFYVTDPNTGNSTAIDLTNFLTPRQIPNMGYLPDLPLQFAHYLADYLPRRGPRPLQVQARIYVAINGRKPVLYLDPIVDLAAQKRTFGRPTWLRRNDEPLPPIEKRYQQDMMSSFFPSKSE